MCHDSGLQKTLILPVTSDPGLHSSAQDMERTFQTLRGGDHGRVLLSELRTADGGDCTSKCTRLSEIFLSLLR